MAELTVFTLKVNLANLPLFGFEVFRPVMQVVIIVLNRLGAGASRCSGWLGTFFCFCTKYILWLTSALCTKNILAYKTQHSHTITIEGNSLILHKQCSMTVWECIMKIRCERLALNSWDLADHIEVLSQMV